MPPARLAFIVRVWFERDDASSGAAYRMRGSVQSAAEEQVHYIESVEQAARVLAEYIEREAGGGGAAKARGGRRTSAAG